MFRGTEALGLIQSRAGVTLESLVQLKEALNLVVNEEPRSDPYTRDDQVTASIPTTRSVNVLIGHY